MNHGVIRIPELEEAVPTYRLWTVEEETVMRLYYRVGMAGFIKEYLGRHHPPGRSLNSIHSKAKQMGLQGRTDESVPFHEE